MRLHLRVMSMWRTGQYILPADFGFAPKHMFAGGRVGWWLDPLDFSTEWQDSAGTTPYTAVEQYVGKIVDKSPNALAFTQATSASRPVVSARVNTVPNSAGVGFLNYTATSLAGAPGTAPDGVGSAQITVPDSSYVGRTHITYYLFYNTSGQYVFIAKIKKKEYKKVALADGFGGLFCVAFDSDTGTEISRSGAVASASIVPAENGYWLATVITTSLSGTIGPSISAASDGGYFGPAGAYSVGDGTSGAYFADVDFLPLSQAHLPYQRVNTATDYDTTGFPYYAKFDGVATNLIGASGGGATAGFYFGAAVQFGTVGAVQTIVSDAGTNTGYKVQLTAANQIQISAGNGTAFTAINTTDTFSSGDVAFIELFDDGTNLSACLGNGTPVTVARPAVSAGTAQMTLAKDNNAASNYAGISIFSAVYIKDYCPSAAQRADYKRWALQRAGVAS